MRDRRRTARTPPVFAMAALSYLLNCALGAAVATKLVDTTRFRWVHHALYILTLVSAAAALSSALWGVPRRRSRRAALVLAPAAVPLAVIPFAGTRGRRHPLVALSAAPFFVASLVAMALDPDRRK
ncbi:hypothetical protein [Microbacterium sp. NPDC056234]|uniref:hypothetical protein n=1 Tax=Microbacterium sp. NPDC056234 TaxID=3345757 RepID=UPI0035DE28C2